MALNTIQTTILTPEKNSLHNVTSPTTATQSTDGIIVRDFAFTDSRHFGNYPKLEFVNKSLRLPVQGDDLVEILRVLEVDLSKSMQKPVLLSCMISNFNYSAQNELEMDIEFGQELIVVEKGHLPNEIKSQSVDRWASMDDDSLESCTLQVEYEPDLQDFADTITGFQNQSMSDCFLCLRLKAAGHLQGVGHTLGGQVRVELQEIGLIPIKYRTWKN